MKKLGITLAAVLLLIVSPVRRMLTNVPFHVSVGNRNYCWKIGHYFNGFMVFLIMGCNSCVDIKTSTEDEIESNFISEVIFQNERPLDLNRLLPLLKSYSFNESEKFTKSLYADTLSVMSRPEIEAIFKPSSNYFFYEYENCHFRSFEDSLANFISFTSICYSEFDAFEIYLVTCDYSGNVIDQDRVGGYSHGSDSYGTGEIWELNIEVTKDNPFEYNMYCTETIPYHKEEGKELTYRDCEYRLFIDSFGKMDWVEISDWKDLPSFSVTLIE
ncbi:MAG: hypothetical protein ACI8ZM_000816 [Crocinitomix sp.]|jgi:hypothetical protein